MLTAHQFPTGLLTACRLTSCRLTSCRLMSCLLLACLLTGCGSEPPRFHSLALTGTGGEKLAGDWYAPGGSLELRIRHAEPGHLTTDFRMRPGGSAPLAAWVAGENLHIRIEGWDGPQTVVLEPTTGPDLLPPGSDACLRAHGVWLFRNPHPSWIATERLREQGYRASRAADAAFDWLVRAL